MRLPDRLKRPKLGAHVRAEGLAAASAVAQIAWLLRSEWSRAVDFAHLRSSANAGTGQRPHDIFGVSLCRVHHDEQHRLGAEAFVISTTSISGRWPPSSRDGARIGRCARH